MSFFLFLTGENGLEGPVGFSYPPPLPAPAFQPLQPSYPLQRPVHSQQPPMFVPQQYPSHPHPLPHALLDDPAFSSDPRSNPYFFSMNDREEIYPASISDSLSEDSSVPDEESEIDHSKLPPRLRPIHTQDAGPHSLPPGHSRSHSVPYPPIAPQEHSLARSHSTRVIPVPPSISRTATPGGRLRKPQREREDPRQNLPGPSHNYSSASVAAQDFWPPPPPYTDSESGSSASSSPQTPASSSSHLPRDAHRSTSSIPSISSHRSERSSRKAPSPNVPAPEVPSQSSRAEKLAAAAHKTPSAQPPEARPAIAPRNASAPELHEPPPPTEVPPRPSTVPIPAPLEASVTAPVAQRKRSKNPSIAAAPRDLDRIDELDESDPLGLAWHHDGPYEAIAKAAPVLYPDQSIAGRKRTESPKRKPVQPYDSVSVGVEPGQLFPSHSQYQPAAQHNVAPQQHNAARAPENPPMGSPLTSPLMQVPVQRRVPPSGQLPSSPLQYNNLHMATQGGPPPHAQGQPGSRAQQAPPVQHQRSRTTDEPAQPSPPLPNPYSPAEPGFPRESPPPQNSRNSPPRTPAPSPPRSGPSPPTSNGPPRPDIAKSSGSLLPRHLPKKLTRSPNEGAAHVEVLAQRHASHPPPSDSHQQHQTQPHPHGRAQDIPMSQGPNVLRKRHTTGGALPLPSGASVGVGGSAGAEIPSSNTTAALFAARVRFAEPPRAETKEERRRREKERGKMEKIEKAREKEREKEREREQGGFLGGIFVRDRVKEAEIAREREAAKAAASASAKSSGRKLSKRR
ncbi:hypothetical protein BD413DRAFT_601185 [Trametes elegans]|nr:hypothetical protein BD413DRAFT_601185 [Trametes elegans]